MEQVDKILEKLREWTEKIIEALFGPQSEPEGELIPIPVKDYPRNRY